MWRLRCESGRRRVLILNASRSDDRPVRAQFEPAKRKMWANFVEPHDLGWKERASGTWEAFGSVALAVY